MFFTVTLAPGTTAPDVSVTVPESADVAPPWAKVAGAPRASAATTRKPAANSLRTARVMKCSFTDRRNRVSRMFDELLRVGGAYPPERGVWNAVYRSRAPPPAIGIQRVCRK